MEIFLHSHSTHEHLSQCLYKHRPPSTLLLSTIEVSYDLYFIFWELFALQRCIMSNINNI